MLASGVIDMISDGTDVWTVENGTPRMSLVTGTGCILSCMTAAYLSVAAVPAEAVLYATALLGIAGEIADMTVKIPERVDATFTLEQRSSVSLNARGMEVISRWSASVIPL